MTQQELLFEAPIGVDINGEISVKVRRRLGKEMGDVVRVSLARR
ncbi:hypothetical protein WJX64_04950 [Leifsonia sp. YIM 134122]|uniref:DUF1905 domain-containing protein n=1 Tax=Leifsonia stereocauli TaxID=3134136 RepID=A0ABU9W1L4_9MICO